MAEGAARELANLPLEDALQLVHSTGSAALPCTACPQYGERGAPMYENAAMRWLERYQAERSQQCARTLRSR